MPRGSGVWEADADSMWAHSGSEQLERRPLIRSAAIVFPDTIMVAAGFLPRRSLVTCAGEASARHSHQRLSAYCSGGMRLLETASAPGTNPTGRASSDPSLGRAVDGASTSPALLTPDGRCRSQGVAPKAGRGLQPNHWLRAASSDHKSEGQVSDGERPSIVGPQTTG
jgi:hypothetical protein